MSFGHMLLSIPVRPSGALSLRRTVFFALLPLILITCKSAPTTRQTAEAITDAAVTQTKIDRAVELADEVKNARTPETRAKAVTKYIDASQTALYAAEQTIDNLRKSLIRSETARGELDIKLSECRESLPPWWIKWVIIIGGPLALTGAFLLGRKTA